MKPTVTDAGRDATTRRRGVVRTLVRWGVQAALTVIAIIATLLLVGAFASRRMPDLDAWHRTAPEGEFVAADLGPDFGLEAYLEREAAVFDALADVMLDPKDLGGRSPLLRYVAGGVQDPARRTRNWNRTVELIPEAPKGGVLLLHGLSDSPYSMRSTAELMYAEGYHVLVMRMPGHGAVPAGLLDATWQDMAAAVKVGARHLGDRIDASKPFYIGGYSNGGALAVDYCLDALGSSDRLPDRLFLFSPAIGITPFARVAGWHRLYSFIPYFEKSKWVGIEPEYDPYKYNSFPKHAGAQSWGLAAAVRAKLDARARAGRLDAMPPILTFQSVVDDTVDVRALIARLYDRLPANGSEVVFFDINRAVTLDGFVSRDYSNRVEQLMQRRDLAYTITRITNLDPRSLALSAQSLAPGSAEVVERPLALAWPRGVFSLAHVSIPFPPTDPLYGDQPPDPPAFGLHLGTIAARGERGVLKIPASQLMRLRHNPFYGEMARRLIEAITPRSSRGAAPAESE